MSVLSVFLLLLVLSASLVSSDGSGSTSAASRIKHIIVLMMENRSFDHLLGWLHDDWSSAVDGLTAGATCPIDPNDASKGTLPVTRTGYDEGPDDPMHNFDDILQQVDNNRMDGFVANAISVHHDETNPIRMFDSTSAPVLNGLAKEFAVFNYWFCSVPGPTDPNRGYAMAGTSEGVLTNFNGTLWDMQSYFDLLRVNGHTFGAYYQDDPWAVAYFQDMQKPENSQFMKDLDTHFYTDAAAGTLAEFVWLQPRMNAIKEGPTWQHPDASVKLGEQLINKIYTAIRASPVWNETLFVITYDENGGFLDHVAPPDVGVPNPDGIKASNGFNFDRLGIRVPTLAISPWIAPGTIISSSFPGEQPTPNSAFESTSIMATTHKILGLTDAGVPLLGARAPWANTFVGLVEQLSQPRLDCPESMLAPLEDSPEEREAALLRQRAKKLNDHMEAQLNFYCSVNHPQETANGDCPCRPQLFETQGAAVDVLLKERDEYIAKLRAAEAQMKQQQAVA